MKIALGQINPRLGDYAYNAAKILKGIKEARAADAELVVFSEMALFGYPAYDLLERPQEVEAQNKELMKLIKEIPAGITAIVGAVIKNPGKKGKEYQNAAVVISKGKKPQYAIKQLLPSYDVFDDTRFFEPGTKTLEVTIPGIGKTAITICEDMWAKFQNGTYDPLAKIKNVKLVVNISASPFTLEKNELRLNEAKHHAKRIKAPFVYINQVCGQDELIFDGHSFVLDKSGNLVAQAPRFKESLTIVDFEKKTVAKETSSKEEILKSALVLGIKDFVSKTNQKKVHLGLSGGIDSSLVACLSVDALGADNVIGIMLPGPFSSEGSVSDSVKLASNLGIKTEKVSIDDYYQLGLGTLEKLTSSKVVSSTATQNLQARLRAIVLMMYSNVTGSMLLSTTNKSEFASGYSTLYGDTCGGLAPIGDLTKEEVYAVSKLYGAIPESVFTKAPSAELAPNQKDEDFLPPYKQLDQAVKNLIGKEKKPENKTETWLEEKLFISEFKRWQSPPILRISKHAFGRGRRIPIARAKPK